MISLMGKPRENSSLPLGLGKTPESNKSNRPEPDGSSKVKYQNMYLNREPTDTV